MAALGSAPLIARPRLAEALALAIDAHAVVAVVAPAGYGKSSAIALALEDLARPAVRYTAQLWHAGDFVEPLVAEVRRTREDFGRLTLALAQRRPGSADARSIAREGQRLGAAFASDLGHVPTQIVISFEDVQLLEGDAYFAAFLTGLVRVLPEHVRLVLEGRHTPDGVPLAEWLLHGRAAVFGAEQLRLDAEDVTRLAERMGTRIDAAGAAALTARFDGWAAGITLHFAAGDRALPPSAGGVDASTSALLGAAIDALSPDLVAFLERTAVYETLDYDVLARDARLAEGAAARLRDLERSGAMLTVLRPRSRYRLHAMLRGAFEDRVREREGPGALHAAHGAAATILEELGFTTAALFHYQESKDVAALAQFLQRRAYALFIAGLGERATRIARGLDAAEPRAAGVAAQYRGMLARQRGEPGAAAFLATALAAAEAHGDAVAAASLRVSIVEDTIARGSVARMGDLEALERAGTILPAALADANLFAGWSAALGHDLQQARRRALAARDLAGDSLVARTRVASLGAYVETALGNFDSAAQMLDETLRALEDGDHIVLLANTLVWYARFALVWGDLTAAKDMATQGRDLAQRLSLSAEFAGVELALAEIAAHEGDVAGAERAVARAHDLGESAWYFADRDRVHALAARFVARARFARDGAAPALAHLREVLAAPDFRHDRRAPLLADAAAFAVIAGEREPAELDAFSSEAAGTRVADGLDAVALAGAIRIAALARAAAGLQARTDLLPPGIETVYAQLFTARLDLVTLADARTALASPDATARTLDARGPCFEARLLRALAPAGAAARSAPAPVPAGASLTKRENEILALLGQGLTNKEIAQRFTLSPRTVDTHVERVLAKLGVTTRTRAVAAAMRAGLIEVDAP